MTISSRSSSSFRQRLRNLPLGQRLTLSLLPIVLIPTLFIGLVGFPRIRGILREQSANQLANLSIQQVSYIQEWTKERRDFLFLRTGPGELKDSLIELFESPAATDRQDQVRLELEKILRSHGNLLFSDAMLVEVVAGVPTTILVATDPALEGLSPAIIQTLPTNNLTTMPVTANPVLAPDNLSFLTSSPLRVASTTEIDALIVGINSGSSVGTLLKNIQVFWQERGSYRLEKGRTYLAISPDYLAILPRYSSEIELLKISDHPAFDDMNSDEIISVEYDDFDGVPILGSIEWIPDLNIALIIELPQEIASSGLNTMVPFIIFLLIGMVLLFGISIPLVTNRSLQPLHSLSQSVLQMAAGKFDQRVDIKRHDEVGTLAESFNQMAADLHAFYQSLEARVRARTRQIHTAAAIARDTTTDKDIHELMDEAVWLISNQFDYYHAAIFLLDPSAEYAVLQSASSAGGQKLLEKKFRLPVGEVGIVGHVTGSGEPYIAPDVSKDSVHYANPDLRETRSQLTIPLKRGERIIGALDIHSKEINAFSEEDILVLETMADQLAIACENANLIEQQSELAELRRRVLEVNQLLSKETHLEQLINTVPETVQTTMGFLRATLIMYQYNQLQHRSSYPAQIDARPDIFGAAPGLVEPIEKTLSSQAPIFLSPLEVSDYLSENYPIEMIPSVLTLPLIATGSALGVLAIERTQTTPPDSEEANVFEILSGQIGATIQNAILLEETRNNLSQLQALYRQQSREAWSDLLSTRFDAATMSTYELEPGRNYEQEKGMLVTPLNLRGEPIGSVRLASPRRDGWKDDDIQIIETISDEIANAVEQQRLMVEIHRRAAELQMAAEIARDATGLLDIDTLLERITHLIRQRFGYYHVAVLFIDAESNSLVVQKAVGERPERTMPAGLQVEINSSSIVGHVANTGEIYTANFIDLDPHFAPHANLPDTQSELAIPLRLAGSIIGVLDVLDDRPNTFQEADVSVLEILADQLSVALQNARTYTAAIERAQREETIVRIADTIRQSESIDEMLQHAVRDFRSALGSHSARIRLIRTPQSIESSELDTELHNTA